MRHLTVRPMLLAAVLLCGACQPRAVNADAGGGATAGHVESRPPEGTGQQPAFAGQTRAPRLNSGHPYKTEVLARGLDHPWALQFLPDGAMIVTERPGRMRLVSGNGSLSAPIGGVPPVVAREQGGLLDLALDPDFARNHTLYFTFLEPRGGDDSGIALARAELTQSGAIPQLDQVRVIFRAEPSTSDDKNVGSRVVVATDGTLFVTVGDRFSLKDKAQTLDNDLGKVVRLNKDGSIPRDNPFVGRAGARPEIWSYGHRNPEGAAINPADHRLWTIEHGPRGGDEINRPDPGKNYGWPVITYGIDYNGMPIGQGITSHPGMEQPLYYWDPVIAPSGMTFYEGSLFPAWRGSLMVGGLRGKQVARLTLQGTRITGEERLLTELNHRIRDVRSGPDGAIYVLTDETNGEIIKVLPK